MLRVQNQPASSSIHCAQLKTPTHEAKTNTTTHPPPQKKKQTSGSDRNVSFTQEVRASAWLSGCKQSATSQVQTLAELDGVRPETLFCL